MSDQISCSNCGTKINVGDDVGMVGKSNKPEEMRIVCLKCHEIGDYSQMPEFAKPPRWDVRVPVQGTFKPQKNSNELATLREGTLSGSLWTNFELELLAVFQVAGSKLLRITFGSRSYQGYRVEISWDGEGVASLTFPGQSSKTKPPLNIYQLHRIKLLGLMPSESAAKGFVIPLSAKEREITNVVRVISHTLEFGYFVDLTRIHSISPILDV